MTDDELQAAIAARPKIKITKEYMESRIHNQLIDTCGVLTICILQFDNGFKVVGTSAPAHPDNFDEELGKQLAYNHALSQAWPLFGFLLCEALHRHHVNAMNLVEKHRFDFSSLLQEINAHGIPSPGSTEPTAGA